MKIPFRLIMLFFDIIIVLSIYLAPYEEFLSKNPTVAIWQIVISALLVENLIFSILELYRDKYGD